MYCLFSGGRAIFRHMAEKFLTVKKVAERFGVASSTVRAWCLRGTLKGARLEESPSGSYYAIPESSLAGFDPPKRGPKPKVNGASPSSDGRVVATRKRAAKKSGK